MGRTARERVDYEGSFHSPSQQAVVAPGMSPRPRGCSPAVETPDQPPVSASKSDMAWMPSDNDRGLSSAATDRMSQTPHRYGQEGVSHKYKYYSPRRAGHGNVP